LNDQNSKAEQKEYTTLLGNAISERKIITPVNTYKMYCCNFFDYERLDSLFANDIIYVDGTRISNKPNLKKGERLGNSNFFDLDFETNPTTEILTPEYQLYQGLELVQKIQDTGTFTLDGYNTASSNGQLILIFNKNIEILANFALKVYKDGVLHQTVTAVVVVDDTLTTDINITANGVYDIIIDENLIKSGVELYAGLRLGDLKYTIIDGEYDGTEYDNDDYLTD